LTIQIRNRLLQHVAVTRVAGGLKLLREALPGKEQAPALPVALLLAGRKRRADGIAPLRHFLLLLLYGLTLPTARHVRILPEGWLDQAFAGETGYLERTALSGSSRIQNDAVIAALKRCATQKQAQHRVSPHVAKPYPFKAIGKGIQSEVP
jgi:hypothetical protein